MLRCDKDTCTKTKSPSKHVKQSDTMRVYHVYNKTAFPLEFPGQHGQLVKGSELYT